MYEKLTIHELRDKIQNKEVTIKEVLDSVFQRIEAVENKVEAYKKLQAELENLESLNELLLLEEDIELGKEVLVRFAKELENVAEIETQPKLEGRFMTMMLMPKKEK